MIVQYLLLDNLKCFAGSTKIDFTADKSSPHKWVVVYGDNGLGKSTLLRALGIALTGQPALNALLPSAEGWARLSKGSATIGVRILKRAGDAGPPHEEAIKVGWVLQGANSGRSGTEVFPAHSIRILKNYEKSLTEIKPDESAWFGELDNDVGFFNTHIATDERNRGWLVCGYGPHRRLTGASSDLTERISPDGRAARLVTLFHEKAALTSAEVWLSKLHHYALVDKDGPAERRLDAVVNIINMGLLHGDVKLAEITPDGVYFETPFSPRIPIEDLSDGYRSVLALALDLLRHIEYCFDIETVLETKDGRTIITAECVVLIDEIDAHLHPSWQRQIGAWLHQRFPNVQFIVATHSPLIATRVSETEGMVIRLVRSKKGDSVEVITEEGTIGLTADQTLTGPNFGLYSTRSVLVDDMVREMEQLLELARAKKASPAQRKRLHHLQVEYDRVAAATPTYEGIKKWREDGERILRANDDLARKERKRR